MIGEYQAWVERDLPADGWKIWIYRWAGVDKIDVIYPAVGLTAPMTYQVVIARAQEESTEPSLRIPYGAGEALLEALGAAIKPLTPREDPYVKTLLERITDLKAHIKDLEMWCGLDPKAMKKLAKDILRFKPDIVLGPDEEPPPGSIPYHMPDIVLGPDYREKHGMEPDLGLPVEGAPKKGET